MKGKPQTITSAEAEETGSRERVYRIFRVGTAGRGFYSALAGLFEPCKGYARLDYAIGKATYDVAGGKGVFIYLDKDFAIEEATAMAKRAPGRKLVVFAAKPIGAIVIPAGKSKTATCDGVIPFDLVKVIPVVAKETWKDITDTLEFTSSRKLTAEGWVFYQVTADKIRVATGIPLNYRVATTGTIKVEKKRQAKPK